jgi:hypothetical protein
MMSDGEIPPVILALAAAVVVRAGKVAVRCDVWDAIVSTDARMKAGEFVSARELAWIDDELWRSPGFAEWKRSACLTARCAAKATRLLRKADMARTYQYVR